MKLLYILLPFLVLLSCKPTPKGPLEVYRVNKAAPDTRKNEHLEKDCFYCIDLTTEKLYAEPLFTESDIAGFNWDQQQLLLSESGQSKLKKVHIPPRGLAVAFVLGDEPIYGFWLWSETSGFGCDRVYTYPRREFKLSFGIPEAFAFGDDPRFDERLKTYVEGLGKKK